MKKRIVSLIYRHLTAADFKNINKRGGEEPGGGGQSYIDIGKKNVSEANMIDVFGNPTGHRAQGPVWDVSVNSFIISDATSKTRQDLTLYQRRGSTYCIASQKIHSKESNRVKAWHPDNGFPKRFSSNIVVYLAKSVDGEIWAGWFRINATSKKSLEKTPLTMILSSSPNCGYINLLLKPCFATGSITKPFIFSPVEDGIHVVPEEIEIIELNEDISPSFDEDLGNYTPAVKERIQKYRSRSKKLSDNLKKLYNGKCQISGDSFSFKKKDGTFYTEVHHLIPLGKNGSDSYCNAIVVSPLIHRMLHFADVGPIDLSLISDNKLPIKINGVDYTIEWKPEHNRKVQESLDSVSD